LHFLEYLFSSLSLFFFEFRIVRVSFPLERMTI
jgi:hypothetical protein